jgi:hypothetical protein
MSHASFWNLRYPESRRKNAEWVLEDMDTEIIKCPRTDGHQRGGKRLTDLSVTLRGGKNDDFVWTWLSDCLIQDHVLKLFQKNGFTGFEVKPVKAKFRRKSELPVPKLWELIVTGWAGMAPPESGIKLVERCEGCGHTVYSGCSNPNALIKESQWDGSDFFMVWPLPRFIFVTDRVVQTISNNNLTGVVLRQQKELGISDGYSPGRLSYWMPKKRAHELGAPLGIE